MDDDHEEQPTPRERIGSRAWVRTVGLIGGGVVAGVILAGTLTANAATDDGTTSTAPTPDDCPDGAGASPDSSSGDAAS